MAEESLKNKTVKGTIWSGIDNVAQMGVQFIVSIVLARILTPDDYGLLGIMMIFTSVCTALINSGFTTALIRKPEADDDDYNTSFMVNMGMSIALYALVFILSPHIADFFEREELTGLTRVISLGMVIGALSLVQQTRLTKRIDFKTQTKITLTASIFSGIILLWGYDKWIPEMHFSVISFHELFGFGWKMMVSAMLDSLWKELYQVVIGRFYNPSTLGQYTRAKQFSILF